jgi:hypothetical protein
MNAEESGRSYPLFEHQKLYSELKLSKS